MARALRRSNPRGSLPQPPAASGTDRGHVLHQATVGSVGQPSRCRERCRRAPDDRLHGRPGLRDGRGACGIPGPRLRRHSGASRAGRGTAPRPRPRRSLPGRPAGRSVGHGPFGPASVPGAPSSGRTIRRGTPPAPAFPPDPRPPTLLGFVVLLSVLSFALPHGDEGTSTRPDTGCGGGSPCRSPRV